MPPVQRLRAVHAAPDLGHRGVRLDRPRPHGVQRDQTPHVLRVDAREPRAQGAAEAVAHVRHVRPAEVVNRPFDRAQIVDELQRHVRRERGRSPVPR